MKLEKRVRERINNEFDAVGLTGKQYYQDINAGLNAIGVLLGKHNIVVKDITTADMFMEDQGRRNFDMEMYDPNREDPFTPGDEITNSRLVMSWHTMQSGRYEIIVYLS